ncbi:hypothetical protein HRI_004853400 [Hibiscus trionum]|uniref:GIR1-like zinc ribbon domain-containing protein n=1 Tax=Hibiscus trionum TaxID=183268 RepID=A0A9W7JBA6_HIBTR|nr:hypothetical protein HRI_004853400 [Hibiscus trionum]
MASSSIKQESYIEDEKSSTTSLISTANLPIKDEGSTTNPTPKNNKERRDGNARKRSFTEIGEEENGKNVDLNLRLTPLGLRLKDRFSSNQCPETSSVSLSTSSCMPLNNEDSPGEEVEFSNTIVEEPSLVVMGCSNCLMYVMVSEIEPSCPRCHSSVLIDIFRPKSDKKPRQF